MKISPKHIDIKQTIRLLGKIIHNSFAKKTNNMQQILHPVLQTPQAC